MANTYYTSDGQTYTQQQIRTKLSNERKGWRTKNLCEAFGYPKMAWDTDHSISQKRCKELKKVELIWSDANISWSHRLAHMEWESYKSGKFSYHKNAYQRMLFVAMHDTETFIKRYYCITNEELKKKLTPLFNEITSEVL